MGIGKLKVTMNRRSVIRIVLKIVIPLLMGFIFLKSWYMFENYSVKKYIKDPIISSDVYMGNLGTFTQRYTLINENYRILCYIDLHNPYKQKIDTTFHVYSKEGVYKNLLNRKSPVLMEFFREYYKWK